MESQSYMWTIVVVGIGTVFLCLIALVAMVNFFKALFVCEKKAAAPEPAAEPAKTNQNDDMLAVLIAAAVSAASAMPLSSFKVTSIESSGFNTPVWGHIDRAHRAH